MTTLLDEGYARCEQITRARARSFAFASAALGREARRASFAVYAFCRRCDDAVDGVPREEARAALDRVRREVDAVYAGEDFGDPVLAAFGDTARARGVPREAVLGLVRGMEQDLHVSRYATWADLEEYCELAAGTVGRMMASVLGVKHPDALVPAAALGRAMQLTNVLRDVREDLVEHGRVYLPQEALAPAGLDDATLARWARAGRLDDSEEARAFRRVMQEGAARARALYAAADRGVPQIASRAGRACVRLMGSAYASILPALGAQGWDPFAGRASTGTWTKLRAGAQAFLPGGGAARAAS